MAEMFDASSFKFDDENEQTFDASSFKFDEEPSAPALQGATDVDSLVSMHQNKDEAPVEEPKKEDGTVGFEYNGKKANVGDYVAVQDRDGKTSLKKVNDPVDGVAVLEDTDDKPEEGKTYPTLTADEWDEGRKNKKIRRNVSPAEYRRLQHEAETGSEVFGEKSGKTASFLADTIPFGGRMIVDEERGKIARMEKFVKGEPELRATKDSGEVFTSTWGNYSPQVKINGDEAWEIEAKSLGVDKELAKRGKDEDSESYRKRLRGLVLEKMKETVSRQDKAKQELEYIESDWKDMVFGSGRQSIGYGLEYAATAPIGGAMVKGGAALLKAAPKVAKAVNALTKAAPKTAKVLAGTAKVVTEAQPMALVEAESNYEKFRENGYTMKNGALEIESRADDPETALIKAIANGEATAITEVGLGKVTAPVYRAIGKAIGKNAVGQAVVKVAKAYGKIRDATKFGDIAFEELPEENIQFFFSDVLGWGKKDSEYNGFLNELNEAFSDGGQYTLKGQWNTALGMLLQMGGQAALAGGATAVEVSANSRELANLLEGAGMSKEQVANLSYGQRIALARLHNKFANNRDNFEHALELFGGYLGQHANEIVKQTTFGLQNDIAKYGEEPHQFEIQSEVGVDGKPKPVFRESIHIDGITGKSLVRKEMFDPKAGVTIVENEDGSYEIYDEIHPERSFATDNFDEALRCANLYSLSNQKLNLDNRLKEEYAKNLLETKYKNTNFEGYDTVGNLYHAAVEAINETGSFHGYQLNQIFKTDSKGEVILPPQTVEGGVKGLAGKDGTIVAVLDNIKTAKDMNAMFSHETKHLKATKDMLMRISPKSECWKYVEMIRKAYAEKGIEASELKIREEGFAYWAQQRGHNPSLMQRVSHAFTTKNGELNDADLEVIASRMEREGETAEEADGITADFIGSTYTMSDSQALESEETQEEVGNEARTDETPAQPEQAPRVTPPAGEEARPLEAGAAPSEVGGEVAEEAYAPSTERDSKIIQGTDRTVGEAKKLLREDVDAKIADAINELGVDIKVKGIELHGSRVRGDAKDDSDLDLVVEYSGDVKEDVLFEILNENPTDFNGIKVDINPINAEKTGSLKEYMARSEQYDAEKSAKAPTSASTETKVNTPPTTTESAEGDSQAAESEKKPVVERSVIEKMTEQAPVEELPVAEVFNDDTRIPNFKEGANPETGEVEPLTGEPYDLVSNPIVVMEFKDGKKVVVTGRHRLALYKRSGRKTIAARVIKESDGWTVDDAKMIDSIGNIIDEKGSVKDYVKYFEDAKPSRESAESGGFLSRPKGRLAYSIYEGASADTRAAIDFEGGGADGQISVEQAGIIAEAAPVKAHPRNKALQRILVNKALAGLRGKKLGILARSLAEEVKNAKDAPNVGGEMQLDLFTSQEDLNLLAMEEKRADYRTKKSQEYNRIAEVLRTAISKGGKLDLNKEYAEELGITDPKDKKQLAAARDKAVERANYWETAIRLEDADKTAMDNEITAKADATAKKAADAKAKAEAKLAEIKAKREGKSAPKVETPKAPDPKETAYQEWLNKAKFSDTPARRAEWERKQALKDANKKTARVDVKAPEKAKTKAQTTKEPSIKMKDEAAEKRAQKLEDELGALFMSGEFNPNGSLDEKNKNGIIQGLMDETSLRKQIEAMSVGSIRHPRYKKEEVKASYGKEHNRLWGIILSLEPANVHAGGGGAKPALVGGTGQTSRRALQEMAFATPIKNIENYSEDLKYLDRGKESVVYKTADGKVRKVRKISAYNVDVVVDELSKIVYHNYLFPNDAYVLKDFVVHSQNGYDNYYLILEQDFVEPKTNNGYIVPPSYEQIYAALNKSPERFSSWDSSEDNSDSSSNVEAAKNVAINGDYAVYDFQPGRNTFIDAKTGEIRFIDPRVDLNDPNAGFGYSNYGKRNKNGTIAPVQTSEDYYDFLAEQYEEEEEWRDNHPNFMSDEMSPENYDIISANGKTRKIQGIASALQHIKQKRKTRTIGEKGGALAKSQSGTKATQDGDWSVDPSEFAKIEFRTKSRKSLKVSDGIVLDSEVFSLFEKLNTDEDTKKLAEKVFRVIRNLDITFEFHSDFSKDNSIFGLELEGHVQYNSRVFSAPDVPPRLKAEALLHEAIHAVTSYAIDIANGQSKTLANIPISQELKDAVVELEEVYSETEHFLRRRRATNYAQTSQISKEEREHLNRYEVERATKYNRMAEFIAELSNAQVRKELQRHTLWTRIVNGIRKVINSVAVLFEENVAPVGMDKTDRRENALKVSYRILDKFLRNADNGALLAANEASMENDFSPYYDEGTAKKSFQEPTETIVNGVRLKRVESGATDDYADFMSAEFDPSISSAEDAAYLDAVKRGDTETAIQMLIDRAKEVYGNDLVVDDDGNPVVFYHGAQKRYNVLDPAKDKNGFGDVYLTDNPHYADKFGGVRHAVILTVKNPSEHNWEQEGFSNALVSRYQGHDAAYVYGVMDFTNIRHNEVLVRKAESMKEAGITYDDAGNVIPLSQRFNPQSNDIRFMSDEMMDKIVDGVPPTIEEDIRLYGFTNDEMNAARKAAGLEPVKGAVKSDETLMQQAQSLLSNLTYMSKLAHAVSQKARPTRDYENVALGIYADMMHNILNNAKAGYDDLKASIAELPEDTDKETKEELKKQLKELELELRKAKSDFSAATSAKIGGASEQGRALRSNRLLLNAIDYSYAGLRGQIIKDLGGEAHYTPEMDEEVGKLAEYFKGLDDDLRNIAIERLKLFSQKIVNDLKKNGDRLSRMSGRAAGIELKRVMKNYNDALNQIEVHADEAGGTLIGLADQVQPMWGKWLKAIGEYHCYMNPNISEEGVILAIKEDLEKYLDDGVGEDDIRNILTGFGHNYRQSRYESQRKMNDLKAQSRLKLQKEYMLETGKLPPQTGMIRDELSADARALSKEVQQLKKDIDQQEGGANALKGALATAKTIVRNQIEDLERAILNNEKIERSKRSLVEDAELKELKAQRDELRKIYKEMFGENKPTDEQRIKTLEKVLEKSLEKALERLGRAKSGDFSVKKNEPVTSDRIEELRTAIKEANEAVRALKKAAYPQGTPEEITRRNAVRMANRERNLARLQAKIANGDIRKDVKNPPPMPPEMQKKYDELGEQMKKGREQLAAMRLEAENSTHPAFVIKAKEYGKFLVSAQRALRATMDMSAVLRQAARLTLGHPVMATHAFGKAWSAAKSEANLIAVNDEIMSDPGIQEAVEKFGLHLREIGSDDAEDAEIFHGIESNYIKLFGKRVRITDLPFFGNLMLKSERHYLTYLNAISAEMYSAIVNDKARFPDGATPWQKKMIADMINIFNGSAALSKERRQAMAKAWYNIIFWAPQLAISRMQSAVMYDVINPLVSKGVENADGTIDAVSAKERKTVAKIALVQHLKSTVAMIALGTLVRWINDDDDEEYNFKTTDWFEKFLMVVSPRIGNTNIDFTGGEASFMRLLHTIAKQEKRSGTGRLMKFGEYGAPTVMSLIQRFGEGKSAPWLSTLAAWIQGKDYVGNDYTWKTALKDTLVPLTFEDIAEQVQQNGVGKSLLTIPLSLLGAGGGTYDRKPYENAVNRFKEINDNFTKERDDIYSDKSISSADKKALVEELKKESGMLSNEPNSAIDYGIKAVDSLRRSLKAKEKLIAIRKDDNKTLEEIEKLKRQIEIKKKEVLELIRANR